MADSLKIQVVVDGSQVTTGMAGVTSTVEAATARIEAAFGSVANAPAGIQNALLVLQNSARMSAESVTEATAAIASLGGEAEQAASGMSSIERAMALATGRLTGFLGGAGMVGSALGRVAASSAILGPALAAAFPAIAAIALIDVLDKLWDKLRTVALEEYNNAIAWEKIDHAATSAIESETASIDHLQDKIVELTQGKLAALRLEFTQINDGAIQMAGKIEGLFNAMGTQLEKEIPLLDKVREFFQFASTGLILPNQGELAKGFGAELTNTLDTKGLAAGIDLVNHQIVILNTELSKQPDNKPLQEYRDSLVQVLALLETAQTKENVSKQANQAEQEKAATQEMVKANEEADQYNAALQRLANEKDHVARATQELALEEQKFAASQDLKQTAKETADLATRAAAEEAFQQATLARQRDAAIAEIAVQEQTVQERARLGQISAQQEAQQLTDLEAQKLKIEEAYLNARIAEIVNRLQSDDAKQYAEDLKEYTKLLDAKQKAEDQFALARQKNVDNAATNESKTWNTLAQGITKTFDSAIQGVVTGTETFTTAFARVVDSMVSKFIQGLLQMLEQWIVTHVLMISVKKSAQAEEVLSDAKAAAASAWKAVVGIPVIGPALAPAAAAAAFAGVEAFASAAGGWEVPEDQLAMVHKNEMILPANLSSGLKGLIAGGGNAAPSVNVSYGDINAMDSRGVRDVLDDHAEYIAGLMMKRMRRANVL